MNENLDGKVANFGAGVPAPPFVASLPAAGSEAPAATVGSWLP